MLPSLTFFPSARAAGVPINSVFGPANTFSTIGSLVSVILFNVYVVAGVILLFLLIFGGFQIISSAGSGDAEGAAKGKGAVTAAVIGFLIIFGSYWIIQIIEVITGLKIFAPPANYFG